MNKNYILTPHTYMFNYVSGQIERDPSKVDRYRWRAVTSVLYPFSVYDVKKHIPNAEKVFLYNSPKAYFGVPEDDEYFWGYVVVRNKETGFLDSVTFLNKK